jgi:hypothetical protein
VSDIFRITVVHKRCGAKFDLEVVDGKATIGTVYRKSPGPAITDEPPPEGVVAALVRASYDGITADGKIRRTTIARNHGESYLRASQEWANRPEPVEWICDGRPGKPCGESVSISWAEIDAHADSDKPLRVD